MSNSNIKLQCSDENDNVIFKVDSVDGIVTNKKFVSTESATFANVNITGKYYLNNIDSIHWKKNSDNSGISFTGGNVGIETTSPVYSLDVNNTIKSNGLITNGDIFYSQVAKSSTTTFSTLGNITNYEVPGFGSFALNGYKSFLSQSLVKVLLSGTVYNAQIILEGVNVSSDLNSWKLSYSVMGSDFIKNNISFNLGPAGVLTCTTNINNVTSISMGNNISFLKGDTVVDPALTSSNEILGLPVEGVNFYAKNDMTVNNKLTVNGDTTLNGNIYLGPTSGTPSTLQLNGGLMVNGNVTVGGHVIPSSSGVLNIGSSNLKWNSMYVNNILSDIASVGNVYTTNISSGNANINNLLVQNTLDSNNINATNVYISNTLSVANAQLTNTSVTNLLTTNTTLQNLNATNISATSLVATSITGNQLTVTTNLNVNGNISVGNTLNATSVSSGSIRTGMVSTGNINITGDIYKNGQLYSFSEWTKDTSNNLAYTKGDIIVSDLTMTNTYYKTNKILYGETLDVISVPGIPSAPSVYLGSTVKTVGVGQQFSTLTAAVNAANSGDKIQIIGTVNETQSVSINKSLEICGISTTGSILTVSNNIVSVINTSIGNVYIHDLQIRNPTLVNANNAAACIDVKSMSNSNSRGSLNIYIENCYFSHPKNGIIIDGNGFVINNCKFACNTTTGSTETYGIYLRGSVNNSFIVNNQFITGLTNVLTPVYAETVTSGASTYYTGYVGSLIVQANSVSVTNNSNVKTYINFKNIFRQPGTQLGIGNAGEFSLYLVNNDFSIGYVDYSVLMNYATSTQHRPLSFFNKLFIKNNKVGSSISSQQKGFVYFINTSGVNTTIGSLSSGVYQSTNTIGNTVINTTDNLLLSPQTPGLVIANKQSNFIFVNATMASLSATYDETTLDVSGITTGDLYFTGNLYKNAQLYSSDYWKNNGTSIYYTAGNVGININEPVFELDINGILKSTEVRTNKISNVIKFVRVFAENKVSAAIDIWGNLWVWGNRIDNTSLNYTSPVNFYSLGYFDGKMIQSVAIGESHILVLDVDGDVWGMGDNTYKQINNTVTVSFSTPVKITVGSSKKITISAGKYFSHAIDESGNVWGWGYNLNGEVGTQSVSPPPQPINQNIPVNITSQNSIFNNVKMNYITASGQVVYAIDVSGNLWKWGYDSNTFQIVPTNVSSTGVFGSVKITKVAVDGISKRTYAIDENSDLWGWGRPPTGSGIDVSVTSFISTPQKLTFKFENNKIKDVQVGSTCVLVLDTNDNLWTVGYSYLSDLEAQKIPLTYFNNNMIKSFAVGGIDTVDPINSKTSHLLLIDDNNDIWTVGMNDNGQLGIGSTNSLYTTSGNLLNLTDNIILTGTAVGIGTTSPTANIKLDVIGDIKSSGDIYCVNTVTTSDIRIKQNITDADTSVHLQNLMSLKVKEFHLNGNGNGNGNENDKVYGFIAQEVKDVLPEAIKIMPYINGNVVYHDFHFLNKDVIYTEAVGAIQQIYKELQEEKMEQQQLLQQLELLESRINLG